MKINIKATNTTLTPAISDYINKKVLMLDKFFAKNEEILASIEVGKITKHHKSGDVFRAEIKLIGPKETFYAAKETEDLYAAIDEVKDEIAYKLSSKKKKTLHLLRRGSAKIKNWIKGFSGRA